jgi:large repetitive protein
VAALVVVIAGITATVAHAIAFDDGTPCPQPPGGVFACPSGSVGSPYSIQLVGRGGCGPALPYQYRVLSGSLPPGISLSSGGAISGTPLTAGNYDFYLELSDQNPPSQSWCIPKTAERQFSIRINSGLQIVTNSVPQNASVGEPYTAELQAQVVTSLNPVTGSAATGATWSVVSGVGTGLPPGLTLANGLISGSPTTEGSYTFRIQASLNGASHSQTYTLTVRQPLKLAAAKPLATSPLPTAWEVGLPFSAKLSPSGGNGTYTFTLGSGELPTGLTLGPDGTISGTPTAAGVFRATVRLTDSEGRTLDYAASFGVAARLAVSTVALKPAKVGRLYRAKLASVGGVPVKKWKVLAGPLPKGLHFDPTLGTVSGTPTKPGSYRVTFQVTDGLKVVAKKTLRIVVTK